MRSRPRGRMLYRSIPACPDPAVSCILDTSVCSCKVARIAASVSPRTGNLSSAALYVQARGNGLVAGGSRLIILSTAICGASRSATARMNSSSSFTSASPHTASANARPSACRFSPMAVSWATVRARTSSSLCLSSDSALSMNSSAGIDAASIAQVRVSSAFAPRRDLRTPLSRSIRTASEGASAVAVAPASGPARLAPPTTMPTIVWMARSLRWSPLPASPLTSRPK